MWKLEDSRLFYHIPRGFYKVEWRPRKSFGPKIVQVGRGFCPIQEYSGNNDDGSKQLDEILSNNKALGDKHG